MKMRNKRLKNKLITTIALVGILSGTGGLIYNGVKGFRACGKANDVLYDQTIDPQRKNREYSNLLSEDRKHGLNALYCGLFAISSVFPFSKSVSK